MRGGGSSASNGPRSQLPLACFILLFLALVLTVGHHHVLQRAEDIAKIEVKRLAARHDNERDLQAKKAEQEHHAVQGVSRQLALHAQQSELVVRDVKKIQESIAKLHSAATMNLEKLDHRSNLVQKLNDTIQKINNTLISLQQTVGEAGERERNQEAAADLLRRVQHLEHFVGRKLLPLVGVKESVFASLATCEIDCGVHGLSVDIPGITDGCRCECVGGWAGAFCQVSPRRVDLSQLDAPPPKLRIPREREEVPPLNESAPGCKDAAVAYYTAKYKSEEFRTDLALKFFWTLAHNSITPMCSDEHQQVVVIDVGANVGEQLSHWEQEFLNLSHCARRDSLLVMVEPNPQNLVVLRHKVVDLERRQQEKLDAGGERVGVSGRAVVVDAALSYYDGFGKFVVNRKQVMGKTRGNERGSLNLASQDRSSSTASSVVVTRVQRISALIQDLQLSGKIRPNFTIPLLKIDAEGFDPAVIYGAADVLHHTNIVVFECHKLWRDSGFAFRDVAEFFAKFGFQTFKMGMFYWIPVTPPAYWDDIYDETMVWSNCIAVRDGHPFGHMFSAPSPCK